MGRKIIKAIYLSLRRYKMTKRATANVRLPSVFKRPPAENTDEIPSLISHP